jgi:hypothetical protein
MVSGRMQGGLGVSYQGFSMVCPFSLDFLGIFSTLNLWE